MKQRKTTKLLKYCYVVEIKEKENWKIGNSCIKKDVYVQFYII